jgi:hypothetical protein
MKHTSLLKRITLPLMFALLASCASDSEALTQVMVVLDAETQVRTLAREIDIEVRTGTGPVRDWDVRAMRSLTQGSGIDWPLEAALVPRSNDANRVYLVIATARDREGEAIAEVRAISGYQPGKTLSLLLLFEDSCITKALTCNEEQTCRRGECVDAHVDPADLPAYERDDAGDAVLVPFWPIDAGDGDAGGDADSGFQ